MEILKPEKFKSDKFLPEVQAILKEIIEIDKKTTDPDKNKNFLPDSLMMLSDLSEKKNTLRHSQRVTNLGYLLAKKLNFSEEEIRDFVEACLLHDIGKKDIPRRVLSPPDGKFNDDDRREMDKHPMHSYKYLRWAGRSPRVYYPVLFHHESQLRAYPKTNAVFLKALDGTEDRDVDNGELLAMIDFFETMAFGRPYVKLPPAPLEMVRKSLTELFHKPGDPEKIEFLIRQYETVKKLGED
jgi:putative nucleotidyltransferase with HDIG domain